MDRLWNITIGQRSFNSYSDLVLVGAEDVVLQDPLYDDRPFKMSNIEYDYMSDLGLIDVNGLKNNTVVYECWYDQMKLLGLVDVIFNKEDGGKGKFQDEWFDQFKPWIKAYGDPLMNLIPGAVNIIEYHAIAVDKKVNEYKKQLKQDKDRVLASGVWLSFWLNWSLKHCETPVFAINNFRNVRGSFN